MIAWIVSGLCIALVCGSYRRYVRDQATFRDLTQQITCWKNLYDGASAEIRMFRSDEFEVINDRIVRHMTIGNDAMAAIISQGPRGIGDRMFGGYIVGLNTNKEAYVVDIMYPLLNYMSTAINLQPTLRPVTSLIAISDYEKRSDEAKIIKVYPKPEVGDERFDEI